MQTDTEATSIIPTKSSTLKQPPALKEAVKEAVRIANSITKNELEKRYALGVLVLKVQEKAKYGDGALAALAAGTNLDVNTLHAHGTVAETWSEQEFTALTNERGETNKAYRLFWSHFVLLASEKNGRRRNALITAAFKEGLSEKKLRALRAAKSPERKLPAPKSAFLQPPSVLGIATELVTKGEQLKTMLESNIDEPTPELTAQLSAAEQVLAQLEALLAVTRTRISAARSAPHSAPTLKDAVAQVLMLPAYTAPTQTDQEADAQPA